MSAADASAEHVGPAPSTPPKATPTNLPPSSAESKSPLYWVAFDPKWLRRGVVAILILVVLFDLVMWVFGRTANFLFLLLLSWLFGIALEPIVGFFSRRGMKRGLATGIAMITFVLLTILFFAAFGGLLVTQLAELISQVPTLIDQAADWASETFHKDIDPQAIAKQFNISTAQIAGWASNLAGGVLGILSKTVGLVFQGFTMLLFAFYFSAEGPRLRRTIASWLPTRSQRVFATVWDITVQKTGAFVVSRLLLALLAAFFMSLFLLIIGVPYWLPLGLFTGIVSQFIPTIGTYLGILLPCLVAVFNDPLDCVWIIIFGTVYQQVENYFFSPRISAATLDIHPAIAFGSVIVGAALFGAIGAIIAIPLAAAITAIVETYGRRYQLIPELEAENVKAAEKEGGGKGSKRSRRKQHAAEMLSPDAYEHLDGPIDPPKQP
ncbi:MAG: AI-2E family transporter [Candidatus Nanopelagicales bacterium]